MKKINLRAALLVAGVALAAPLGASLAYAEMTKMVGGAPMYPSKNIVQNAVHSKDHTTLVAAVKAAGLVSTLEGAGPFTVFAPTNAAFAKLPAGTVKTLLEPANKGQLTAVLTYHVIPGRITAADLSKMIDDNGGHYTVNTVQGGALSFSKMNGGIAITDAKGDTAMVTIADVMQSNGVIHVINTVLLPG
jgi:uncharacterized surface protein with fasciclin (FAS1) repeats